MNISNFTNFEIVFILDKQLENKENNKASAGIAVLQTEDQDWVPFEYDIECY